MILAAPGRQRENEPWNLRETGPRAALLVAIRSR